MKEIIETKNKLYLFAAVLFLITSIVCKLVPSDVANLLMHILFPIYFFVLILFFTKEGKTNWRIPAVLSMIYILVGYTCMKENISAFKIVIAYFSGLIPVIFFRLKNKNKDDKKVERRDFAEAEKRIVSLVLPAVIMVVLEWYYTVCTFNTISINIDPKAMVIGLILTYSIYFLLLAIIRRTSTACKTFGILFLIVFIINELRIYYTGDTVQITDILFLQNTGEIAGLAEVTIPSAIRYIFFPTVLAIIMLLFFFSIAKRANYKITDKKEIATKAIIPLLILIVMFAPIEPFNKFMTNNVFNIKDAKVPEITSSNTRYYKRYGVLPGLYGKFIETRRHEPNNYNEKELQAMLESAEDNNTSWKKPNIIVIFSESFWDSSKLNNITFDKDIIPNFNRIRKEQKAIEMISPAYGGISSNVEFEILTGGSLNYFSKGYTPYMQLFKEGVSNNNPSIINELNKNGYKTKILNSSSAIMFNCDDIYNIYGVDEKTHLYDELGGKYVTDEYLTDKIIEYFDNKDKDEKVFFFTITMGGHMPYYMGKYDNYDVKIVDSPYDDGLNGVVQSFAQGT